MVGRVSVNREVPRVPNNVLTVVGYCREKLEGKRSVCRPTNLRRRSSYEHRSRHEYRNVGTCDHLMSDSSETSERSAYRK